MAKPDIAEDVAFQQRAWTVQRIGWCVIALMVVAAIAGLFGSGPAANARVQAAAVEIEHERFARLRTTTELTVRALAPAPGGALRIVIDNCYLEHMQITDVVPPPLRKEGGREHTTFVFEARAGAVPDRVVFRVKPERAGVVEARIALDGGEALAFRSFVFP